MLRHEVTHLNEALGEMVLENLYVLIITSCNRLKQLTLV